MSFGNLQMNLKIKKICGLYFV